MRPPTLRPAALACAASLAAAAATGCFTDAGPSADGSGSAATSSTSSDGGSTSGGGSSTSEATDAGCGDGIVGVGEACDDGNQADDDACLATCVPASCGDGVVWSGVEECDDGPANHPTAADACRPDCKAPTCGDGGLYLGPLALTAKLDGSPGGTAQGDDAPRSIGAAADGTFVVAWIDKGATNRALARRLDPLGQLVGDLVVIADQANAGVEDLVLAVAPAGDFAAAWEHQDGWTDVYVRGVQGAELGAGVEISDGVGVVQESPSIGLDLYGRLSVAFIQPDPAMDVRVRRFDDFLSPQDPQELIVSDHASGTPTPPTVAMHESGDFAIAWGDPSGEILYRRVHPGGGAGPIASTGLQVGGGADPPALPWTGALIRASDESVILAGLDDQQRLTLRAFDGDDVAATSVTVVDDALLVPHVDLAGDASGHVAIVWAECGAPSKQAQSCGGLGLRLWVRWFFADLTPTGPAVLVGEEKGPHYPGSVAMAPTGATALTYATGDAIYVMVAPLQCP